MGEVKRLERFKGQVFWRDYDIERLESVADHTWRMALMLLVIEKQLAQSIDMLRALKMIIIHDIPEIKHGDPSPLGSDGTGKDSHAYNKKVAQQKFEDENQAAKEIFSQLGSGLGNELYGLWLEFEEQKTYEAQVVRAIDKYEAKLQAMEWTKDIPVSKSI